MLRGEEYDAIQACKMLWCWRCQQEVPMLEHEECRLVEAVKQGGMVVVEAEARRRGQLLVPMQLAGTM